MSSSPPTSDRTNAPDPALCRACGERAVGELAWHAINVREGLDAKGDYRRCSSCGTLNLVPLPSEEYLDTAYDQILAPPSPVAERSGLRAVLRNLVPNPHELPLKPPRPGARVLDIGCGNGGKLRIYQRAGWECFGADLSPSAIETARRSTTGIQFHAGPVSTIPFDRGSFDLVRSDNVVEHLLDPLLDLRIGATLVRPGGCARVYVPSGTGLITRLLRAGSISSWVPFHLTLFSSQGLRKLLERAGFERVRIQHYCPPLQIRASVEQTLRIRGWSRASAGRVGRILSPTYRTISWLTSAVHLGDELIATGYLPKA